MEGQVCQTEDCSKPGVLQCPTCIKLSISGSFFCSQVHDYILIIHPNTSSLCLFVCVHRIVSKDFGHNTRKFIKINPSMVSIYK